MPNPTSNFARGLQGLGVAALLAGLALPAAAQAPASPAAPPKAAAAKPAPAAAGKTTMRSTSIPGKGLFVGDQLSESTKQQLTNLMLDAIGTQIELALLVPTGPWQIDGAGQGDRVLNEARLRSLRRFLTDRGVDPSRIVVESRIDPKVKTPRLDVQLVTSPATD